MANASSESCRCILAHQIHVIRPHLTNTSTPPWKRDSLFLDIFGTWVWAGFGLFPPSGLNIDVASDASEITSSILGREKSAPANYNNPPMPSILSLAVRPICGRKHRFSKCLAQSAFAILLTVMPGPSAFAQLIGRLLDAYNVRWD